MKMVMDTQFAQNEENFLIDKYVFFLNKDPDISSTSTAQPSFKAQ
jgi:hypothetical protein